MSHDFIINYRDRKSTFFSCVFSRVSDDNRQLRVSINTFNNSSTLCRVAYRKSIACSALIDASIHLIVYPTKVVYPTVVKRSKLGTVCLSKAFI